MKQGKIMKKAIISMFLVLILSSVFVACGGSEGETGGIYGYVTDFDNGAAIPNVEIRLVPGEQAALTDYDGMFEFNDLEPGQYTIFASKVEYLTNRVDITVEDKKVRRYIVIRKRD
jgi:hypothetical protein